MYDDKEKSEASLIKRIIKRTLRILVWITLIVTALLLSIGLAIRIPAVQRQIVQKAVGFLQNKIGTPVTLKSITIAFPKEVVLQELYMVDQAHDTLLYAGEIRLSTNLWDLTKKRIQLSSIALSNFHASIKRPSTDSTFNYTYILRAFSSKSASRDTSASSWQFSIRAVELSRIYISYQDKFAGDDANIHLGQLSLEFQTFDLSKSIWKVDHVTIENSKIDVTQSGKTSSAPSGDQSSTSASSSFQMGANKVKLAHVDINYSQQQSGQIVKTSFENLQVSIDNIDLVNQKAQIRSIILDNSFLSYQQQTTALPRPSATTDKAESDEKSNSWAIGIANLSLKNNSVQYFDFTKPKMKGALDVNHLWLYALNASVRNIELKGNDINADVVNLAAHDNAGITLKELSGKVRITNTSLTADDIHLVSGTSRVSLHASARYKAMAELAQNYQEATIQLQVNPSLISMRDVLLFQPTLFDSLPVTIPKATKLNIKASISGKVNDLSVTDLRATALDSTGLSVRGTIKNLPDMQRANVNLTLEQFYTKRSDVRSILPDTLLPSSVQLPKVISLSGNVIGDIQHSTFKIALTSDVGKIDALGRLDKNNGKLTYDASIHITDLHMDTLLRNQALGPISLTASVKGSGTKRDELNASIHSVIDRFVYNGYSYQSLTVDGSFQDNQFTGNAALKDENLDITIKGDADFQKDVPVYHLALNLLNGDLQKTKIVQHPLKARGKMEATVASADFKTINGNLFIHATDIFNGESLYTIDSLLFISIEQKKETVVTLRSDVMSGNIRGAIVVPELPSVMSEYFNHYFATHPAKAPTSSQHFTFDFVIKNSDLLNTVILPNLDPFSPGRITGDFDSETNKFNFNTSIGKVKYGKTGFDSLTVHIASDQETLRYGLRLRRIQADTLRVDALVLQGAIAHDSIRTFFTILDSLDKEKYRVVAQVKNEKDGTHFHLVPGQLKLNYNSWTVPADNSLIIGKSITKATHFELTNADEAIILNTDEQSTTLSVGFKHLQLKNITSVVAGKVPLDGELSGDLKFTKAKESVFNSRLQINKLAFMETELGDLTILLGHTQTDKYDIAIGLKGDGTDIKLTGDYNMASASKLNITTSISSLNLAVAEPFSMGQLKKVQGTANGELKISGETSSPHIDGSVTFTDAHFTSVYLNNSFTLKKETLSFHNSGLSFSNFQVRDDKNNIANVQGTIKTDTYQKHALDLKITSRDFTVINSSAGRNHLFYGKVSTTINASIGGSSAHPKVELHAAFSNDTNFSYIIPSTEKEVLEQKGIVQFIDRDARKDPFLSGIHTKDTAKVVFTGMDVSATMELTGKETFNIVIDPVTNDKLTVQGNANLTFQMDESGNMDLTGRYEIVKGSYSLSFYKLANRKFEIEKGSSITWSGDPYNATMDIRARYDIEATPLELVANQSGQLSQDEINLYKQRLPFQVFLIIKGQLLTPDISFQLDMSSDNKGAFGGAIYARLQDINTREADLNKQVFGLLILKRFIADNPFDSQSGSDISSTTRMSVGNLLSQQLNQLSQNVKGVKLSVDLKSYDDYSTGRAEGQTSVQLGVSKSLFSDRLVVKLSGNVDIEGENTQNNATDYIGDLALEYQLTDDGRYKITGFRNGNYDMIDGELIETGAGLIFIKDFDTLSELFKSNAKKK